MTVISRKSSCSYNKNWEYREDVRHSESRAQRPILWCGDCLCLRWWGQQSILDWIMRKFWKLTSSWTLSRFRVYSTSRKFWWWRILKKFWMWSRLTVVLRAGRGRLWHMIKWNAGQRKKYESSHILYYVLGECLSKTEAKARWSNQVEEFQMYYTVEEFLGIDGEAIEFEWNVLPGVTTLQILQRIQNDLQSKNIEPEQLPDRIIFMSIFKDIDWTKRNVEETCASNSKKVKLHAQRFPQGHWTFIGPTELPGDEAPSLHKYQCLELWNPN